MLVEALVVPLPIQFSANVTEKALKDGPRAWTPATHAGDLNGVPGSLVQPGSTLVKCSFIKHLPFTYTG